MDVLREYPGTILVDRLVGTRLLCPSEWLPAVLAGAGVR
jgi:hypothetical protein